MKKFNLLVLVLTVIGFSSCAKIDRALEIPEKMDNLNTNMDVVKKSQYLADAKKDLLNTENYDITAPVQFKLMVAAKLMGENFLSVDDAVDWISIQLKEVNKTQASDRFADLKDPAAIKWQDNKFGAILMLTTVSGLLPDSLVQQIVQKIQNSGDNYPEMLAILSMRAYFLQHVILTEAYGSADLKSLGAVEKAIKYNQSLEYILRLPMAADLKTNVTGFSADYLADTDINGNPLTLNDKLTYGVDPLAAKKGWDSIAFGLNHFVKISQFATGQAKADQENRQAAALATVNAGIAAWASVVP